MHIHLAVAAFIIFLLASHKEIFRGAKKYADLTGEKRLNSRARISLLQTSQKEARSPLFAFSPNLANLTAGFGNQYARSLTALKMHLHHVYDLAL